MSRDDKSTQQMNYIEIEDRLLEMQKDGISKIRVVIQLKSDLANKIENILQSRLESDDEEEETQLDQLSYGKYYREIPKSNPREMIGLLKYQKTQIQQFEKKYKGKIVLSSKGIKIYTHDQKSLNDLESVFFSEIYEKIMSYPIQKYGKQIYYSEKTIQHLKQVKVINYNGDKFCFLFSTNDIQADNAIVRMKQVQNSYFRLFVPFLTGKPRGGHARCALKKALQIKARKMIEQSKDQNTQISIIGDGYILKQKDMSYIQQLKKTFDDVLKSQCLLFMVLVKDIPNIQSKLTKITKVAKYLHVAFTNIISYNQNHEPQQVLSMLIKVDDLKSILDIQKFKKILGSFLKQIYQVNQQQKFPIGFFFPFQNQHYVDLGKKFNSRLENNFVPCKINKMQGIDFYTPKLVDQNIAELYLSILTAAVQRKLKCRQLKQKQKELVQYEDMNKSSITMIDQSSYLQSFTLNDTTIIHDRSIASQHNLTNTTIQQINVPNRSKYEIKQLNLQQPQYKQMQTDYQKQKKKDRKIQQTLEDLTGQSYSVFKIIVNQKRKCQIPKDKQFVCVIMKIHDLNAKQDNLFSFSKIKYGTKISNGLLVQLALDPDNMEQKQQYYKLKTKKIFYYPTHEIKLLT